jgi:hypothetical protein
VDVTIAKENTTNGSIAKVCGGIVTDANLANRYTQTLENLNSYVCTRRSVRFIKYVAARNDSSQYLRGIQAVASKDRAISTIHQ